MTRRGLLCRGQIERGKSSASVDILEKIVQPSRILVNTTDYVSLRQGMRNLDVG